MKKSGTLGFYKKESWKYLYYYNFFENIERHVEKPMIFFHIRHSKYYITTYLQAIYRDHYVTSNYRLYHWMRIVKSVFLEKKSEAYYSLRIWIAVSNYVLFTLITNVDYMIFFFMDENLIFFWWKGKCGYPFHRSLISRTLAKKKIFKQIFLFHHLF